MAAEKNSIPQDIINTFNTIISFRLPAQEHPEILKQISCDAEQEARSTQPLLLSELSMTSGMRSSCLNPAFSVLANFNEHQDAFEIALSPHNEKMTMLENIETEINKLKSEAEKAEHQAESIFAADNKYNDAEREFKESDSLYRQMFLEKNSIDAKDFPLFLYLPLLVGVGIVEWAINYMAVLEQYGTPALAMGITAVLGITVACASHVHGTRLKQSEHYFGPAAVPEKKRRELIMVPSAAFALLIAFGFVGWNRYLWALANLKHSMGQFNIEQSTSPLASTGDLWQKVLITMAANILVYLIGAAIAYWVHDPDPDYTTRLRKQKKSQKVWNSWRAKVNDRVKVIRAQLEMKIEAKRNVARGLREEYKPFIDMKTQIDKRSAQIRGQAVDFINGLIRTYRTQLNAIARVENSGLQFNHNGELINLDQFGNLAVTCPVEALPQRQNKGL